MLAASVRTALDLKKAIELAHDHLQPIGVCKSRIDLFMQKIGRDEDDNDDYPFLETRELLTELDSIYWEHGRDCWNGMLDAPFTLTITRPGCEFAGEITPTKRTHYADVPADEAARVEQWFEHGAVSGFGNVRTQETTVDARVRDAREIPAAEFSVSPGLVEEVARHWAAHFTPAAVRVEPYKVHVYGPGGMFRPHKDTPEKGLVGTFLVGLGDSTRACCLRVGRFHQETAATPGSWTAFYPDTPHSVEKLERGHRAVVAFKIFRSADDGEGKRTYQDGREAVPRELLEGVLAKLAIPFGLLLEHKYCMGTTALSGLDDVLRAAAEAVAQKTGARVHFLPVLTKFDAFMEDEADTPAVLRAPVFPLTEAHVAALLEHTRRTELSDTAWVPDHYQEDKDYFEGWPSVRVEKVPREIIRVPDAEAWLTRAKNVPFYSIDFTQATVTVVSRVQEGAEHTGNESRPWAEDSIYLSYAMVVLPPESVDEGKGASEKKNKKKRMREDSPLRVILG
ncbi:hypothetical protein B0H21DRAFT_747247 [Amylocystis lapponica]|nr:hypothetical protein B0H21DRAFT_747247 [Amylocystis lapponica]